MEINPGSNEPPRFLPHTEPFVHIIADERDVDIQDRLDVETYASQLLGLVWHTAVGDAETELKLYRELLHYLENRGNQRAATVLATLANIADTETMRSEAADTMATLPAAPQWCFDPVTVVECWCSKDVFEESLTLVCITESGGVRSGVVVILDNDFPPLGPMITDVYGTTEPDAVVESLREADAGSFTLPVERVSTPNVMTKLWSALCELDDEAAHIDVESPLLLLRAMLRHRCRISGVATSEGRVPTMPSAAEVKRVLNAFLSSPHAQTLPRNEEVVAALELILAFHLPTGLRVGPRLSRTFLHEWVPEELEADDDMLPVLAPVLAAFNTWVAMDLGLSREAIGIIEQQTRHCEQHFREDIPDYDADAPPDWPGLFE